MGELGSLLTRAREARGLTLEDAERDTRISRRYLQALEAETFEVIPAPVYARGFLRSYSQYLGLDPQEALDMFPREEDAEYQRAADAHSPPQRASRETPVSPVSAARPTWRTAPVAPAQQAPQQAAPTRHEVPPMRSERAEREERANRPTPMGAPRRKPPAAAPDPTWEPVIGVDIGVPSPANRIKTDPAAQTRSVVVAIVALGVILGAVLVAILISNLGGAAEGPPGTGADPTAGPTSSASATTAAAAAEGATGIMPTLLGLTEAAAREKLAAAGYPVKEKRVRNSAAKGEIIDQSPAPGLEWRQGTPVEIVISEGP